MSWWPLTYAGLFLLNLVVISSQSQMKTWLDTGTDKERVQKLVSLGIKREVAELAMGGEFSWQPIRTESHGEVALLFLPCGGESTASLYLLEKNDRGWHVADSVGFDCHYDDSVSVEMVPIRSAEFDDVLVHHECEGRGTGFLRQDFNVFAIRSDKFKLVLDAEEILKESDWPERHEVLQRSSFEQIPATQLASGAVEETRCTTVDGKLTIRKRHFRWSPSKFRFLASGFVNIEASDEKSQAACR
jgi:hypothetical protein